MLGFVLISLEAVYHRSYAPYHQSRQDMHAQGIVAAVEECVRWRAAVAWRDRHRKLPLPNIRRIRA